MPKATPSISVPVMNTHASPAQYKAYDELRYLPGGFLPQAGNPTDPGAVGLRQVWALYVSFAQDQQRQVL